jgi:GNAT superfamily N-acetyltransferase
MRVQLYDPSWKERVIALTLQEYPFMEPWFVQRFEALYEHPYQQGRNRIILATEGEALAGIVSYIHWPLQGVASNTRSFQILGVLVSPDFRGRGVFAQLLDAMKAQAAEDAADYLIGFPVPASKPAFVKKGWNHVFDMLWFIKPVSLFAALRRKPFSAKGFSGDVPENLQADTMLQTAADTTFWNYRKAFMPEWPAWWFSCTVQGHPIHIQFRIGQRKGLNEASIGKIYAGTAPESAISQGIKQWMRALRKEGSTVFASVAINPECPSETGKAVQSLFYKTQKKVHFIHMSFSGKTDGDMPERWNMMRGDIDTW